MLDAEQHIAMKELRKGQRSTFNTLFQLHYASLVNFAFTFLQDRQESEDVVQNIFVHLWENAKGIDENQSIKAYLFKAVRNRCLNKLRNKHIRDRHNLLYLEALISQYTVDAEIDTLIEKELKKALKKLPPQVKEIIEQKYLHNKKIREIAEDIGVSNNTVKTQLQRGKAKLKQALGVKTSQLVFLLISFSDCS